MYPEVPVTRQRPCGQGRRVSAAKLQALRADHFSQRPDVRDDHEATRPPITGRVVAAASLREEPVASPAVIPLVAKRARTTRAKRGQMTFLTPEEILAVLRVARECSTRDWAMILLAYRHGLRASEVCGVKLADIDLKAGSISVPRLKGSLTTTQPLYRHRGQPLLDEIAALRSWVREREPDGSDYLFSSQKGGRLHRSQFFRVFRACSQAAALPPEAVGILRRLLERVARAFPRAVIRVRLDGAFATPEVLAFLDRQPGLEYTVNMASNAVLNRRAERAMRRARRLSRQSGETEHVYGECFYAARKWPHRRRVIFKAEVVRHPGREPRDNPRFVVTNLKQSPQWIYERVYCQRGEIENRIKELHNEMEIGRTSCSSFWANQFRVLLTAAAYVLLQELRLRLKRTGCARAQVATLRERLLKLGARVGGLGSPRRAAPALLLPRP